MYPYTCPACEVASHLPQRADNPRCPHCGAAVDLVELDAQTAAQGHGITLVFAGLVVGTVLGGLAGALLGSLLLGLLLGAGLGMAVAGIISTVQERNADQS